MSDQTRVCVQLAEIQWWTERVSRSFRCLSLSDSSISEDYNPPQTCLPFLGRNVFFMHSWDLSLAKTDRYQNAMRGYLFSQHPSLFCQESMLTKFATRLECQLIPSLSLCGSSVWIVLSPHKTELFMKKKLWHCSKCWMVFLTHREGAGGRETERQRHRDRETDRGERNDWKRFYGLSEIFISIFHNFPYAAELKFSRPVSVFFPIN